VSRQSRPSRGVPAERRVCSQLAGTPPGASPPGTPPKNDAASRAAPVALRGPAPAGR
jgi:hypothetical protein